MRSWSDGKEPPADRGFSPHPACSSPRGTCARMISMTARPAIVGRAPPAPGSGPDLAARHRKNQASLSAFSALRVAVCERCQAAGPHSVSSEPRVATPRSASANPPSGSGHIGAVAKSTRHAKRRRVRRWQRKSPHQAALTQVPRQSTGHGGSCPWLQLRCSPQILLQRVLARRARDYRGIRGRK